MRPNLAVAASLILLGACSNGFAKYYSPRPGSEAIFTSQYAEKPPATPKVYTHSNDVNADANRLYEDGYILLGTSSFFAPSNQIRQSQAVAQGKKVGASLVLIKSQYKDTVSGVIPYTVANPPQVSTVNTTGTVNAYGTGGYATGNYNSTSTITSPGGTSTYAIPYNVSRSDVFATYWAKQSIEKMRSGVLAQPLPDDVRHRLQRNTGVIAFAVVRGTPAFTANILRNDVILKVQGEDVIDPAGYLNLMTKYAGQTVEMDLIRGDQPKKVTLTLNKNP